jgi:excinuclease ABC subunit B
VNGKAILYADRTTASMQRALDETNRRRQRQIEYNRQHGIEPRSVLKPVTDVMEAGRGPRQPESLSAPRDVLRVPAAPDQILKEIRKLEASMYRHARNLEFEQAAALRDRIEQLRREAIGV